MCRDLVSQSYTARLDQLSTVKCTDHHIQRLAAHRRSACCITTPS
ncbi:hypothetical protein [Pseudomonas viridiflava]|nr:hypothetical protein [Pseudomonas viridiflava]